MKLYPFIDRYLLFPIAEIFQNSGILNHYNYLKKTEWWSRSEIENFRLKRLVQLIQHCYNNVPYYSELFKKNNLSCSDINSVEDLQKIPILTKDLVRANYDKLISTDAKKRNMKIQSSGGSTGRPLKFITDIECWNAQWATTFRAFDWAQHDLGEKIFTIGGHSLVKKNNILTKHYIFDKYLMRNFKYSGIELKNENMDYLLNEYKSIKPSALRGYASLFYAFAKYIKKTKVKIPKVKSIFTTGEVLVEEYRNIIQEIFQAPVYDEYGAGDGGIMSNECYMHEGLHISEENCIIEIYKDGNVLTAENVGHVLTTDLNNYAFPFLRYQAGDMAYIKSDYCSCGRKTKLIGEVLGRSGRLLYTKNGDPISPTILLLLLWKNLDTYNPKHQEIYNKIDGFQVYQDNSGDIVVRIKLFDSKEDKSIFSYIIENYKNAFTGSNVDIDFVDEIKPFPSGKISFVISEFEKYN